MTKEYFCPTCNGTIDSIVRLSHCPKCKTPVICSEKVIDFLDACKYLESLGHIGLLGRLSAELEVHNDTLQKLRFIEDETKQFYSKQYIEDLDIFKKVFAPNLNYIILDISW